MKYTEEQVDELTEKVIAVLLEIYDPEIPVNIYDLGLIYEINVSDEGHLNLVMTLTSPNCPVAESMPAEVEEKTAEVEGITGVDLDLTFEPTWDKTMMSEEAKFELGML